MGRAPCCDKANVKKGPWSPEEDAKLKSYIEKHGTGGNWIALPQKIGLKRCGKSCRLRWLNYLRPNIKHGGFSEEEDNIICSLYISIGSRWSIIAAQLPGRTDNDIKNYWNTRLKKKLLGKQRKEQNARRGTSGLKQEIRRGNGLTMASADNNNNSNNNNQNPYWPELPVLAPVPYSIQEPRFNDHASVRKLLIKLGGRFSDDNSNTNSNQAIHNSTSTSQFPTELCSTDQQTYNQCINIFSTSTLEALNYAQLAQAQYNGDGATDSQMLQGQSSFSAGLEDMVYGNSRKLDGLEFLVGEDMRINQTNGSATCESAIHHCLDEISSFVYPPVEPNCEGIQQRLLPGCAFDNELIYQGSM